MIPFKMEIIDSDYKRWMYDLNSEDPLPRCNICGKTIVSNGYYCNALKKFFCSLKCDFESIDSCRIRLHKNEDHIHTKFWIRRG